MNRIVEILMERDKVTDIEAKEMLENSRESVYTYGDDPEDVLMFELGLEPDYIVDLLY